MALALLHHVDRAVSEAGGYVSRLVERLNSSIDTDESTPAADKSTAGIEAPNSLSALPSELLARVFSFLDCETLAARVPLVCKAWKEEADRPAHWNGRISAKTLGLLGPLAGRGSPVSPGHLYLALRGRNFVRNPAFKRERNTQLLEIGRPAWDRWKRDAWVMGHTSAHGVDWEHRPAGLSDGAGAGSNAPPPPLPYGGGGVRLGERVQQHLRGFLSGLGATGPWPAHSQRQQQEQAGRAPPPPSCIATSADWCDIMQVIDFDWELQRRGLSEAQAAHLLDSELGLRLSVHVGSRLDHLGQYCVGLLLDEGSIDGSVPQLQAFVMRPSRHYYFSGRVRCSGVDRWERYEYMVPACPRGFRRALVLLRGRRAPGAEPEGQPPVFCGAKFACAELVFE